jgi:hypothetical protein
LRGCVIIPYAWVKMGEYCIGIGISMGRWDV